MYQLPVVVQVIIRSPSAYFPDDECMIDGNERKWKDDYF